MIKIGVISDTHSHVVPRQLLDDLKNVDLIVHAGDLCTEKDLNIFKKIQKVRAVCGNMDGYELHQILPERDIFQINGMTIGLCHGHGSADKVLNFVKKEFKKDGVDVIIFGHSHHPTNEIIDNILYFNPGSPNDIVRSPYCSYGILEIKGDKVSGKIIRIKG